MSDRNEYGAMIVDSQHSVYDESIQQQYLQFSDSEDALGGMDVDLDNINLTLEEENTRSLLIATLQFSNGLSQDTSDINVFAGQEIRVGREDGPSSCQFIIADFRVSKKHFRVYSVVYDPEKLDVIQPLIYCEDLESTNGTYINGECIGKAGLERRGHLLTEGDVIEIKPYWKYHFRQLHKRKGNPVQINYQHLQLFDNRYNVTDRLLGAGQYGKVYLAKELSTSRQIACKIIDLKEAEKYSTNSTGTWQEQCRKAKEERAKILREVTVLAKLSHPHIIDLKKAFCSSSYIYMFTEFAPAGDLFSYCDSHGGKLGDIETRVICRQVTLALEYLHDKHIAHRDIKKENVLVMQTYEFGCRVMLTDFGFAKLVNPGTRRMLSRVGTDGYVAPEIESLDQVHEGYTLSVDMWSLGVLTRNLLIEDALLPQEIYTQQSQETFAKLSEGLELGHLTARAKKFLGGLLILDPTKRMTVHQALQHSWFQKPKGESAAIEEACKRIVRYWKPRETCDSIVEALPDKVVRQGDQPSNLGPKGRRKVPDINPYPFIGLDNRLNPRPQSSRGTILHDLRKHDAFFVPDKIEQSMGARKKPFREQRGRIKSVPGNDLFGKSSDQPLSDGGRDEDGNEDYEDYEDNHSVVQAGMEEFQLQSSSEASKKGHGASVFSDEPCSEQARYETRHPSEAQPVRLSSTPGEQRAREYFTGQIPRYSNAKAYGDVIRKMIMHQAD